LSLILALMIFTTINDVVHLFKWAAFDKLFSPHRHQPLPPLAPHHLQFF
jgi:hypothetical protein